MDGSARLVEWCRRVPSQARRVPSSLSVSLFPRSFASISTAQCPDTSVHSGHSSPAASAQPAADGTHPPPCRADTAARLSRAAWKAASAARAESWT